jgi:hypothetical protein
MATVQDRKTYLLLIKQPTAEGRKEAYARLREMGLKVPIGHGQQALEIVATADQAKEALATGLFSAGLKGSMAKEHLAKLTPEQTPIIALWNARFTESGKQAAKSRANQGKSWGDPSMLPPAPYTAIDPGRFHEVLAKFDLKPSRTDETGKLEGAAFEQFERELLAKYDDPKLAGHLARLALRLAPEYRRLMLELPPEALKELGGSGTVRGEGAK